MKRSIWFVLMIGCLSALYSCGNMGSGNSSNEKSHPFVGTFITETGIQFELREDSTSLIIFSDSLTYESTWEPCKSTDNWEYANIEFAGNQKYYYLRNGKLYRSEREMRHDAMGVKVRYK